MKGVCSTRGSSGVQGPALPWPLAPVGPPYTAHWSVRTSRVAQKRLQGARAVALLWRWFKVECTCPRFLKRVWEEKKRGYHLSIGPCTQHVVCFLSCLHILWVYYPHFTSDEPGFRMSQCRKLLEFEPGLAALKAVFFPVTALPRSSFSSGFLQWGI